VTDVEDLAAIAARWRAEGRAFRPRDVTAEWNRQGREALRERESRILATADQPGSEHLQEVAKQIRDHRAAGNYTTQG
jgi:hypothetical protein